MDSILNWVKFKAQNELKKKSAAKSSKLKGEQCYGNGILFFLQTTNINYF